MSQICQVIPVEAFVSTNLNNQYHSYEALRNKILRMLGYPVVSVELHQDQIYEAITNAIMMYTKYAGKTNEMMVFDSNIYHPNVGIQMDAICTIASAENSALHGSIEKIYHKGGADEVLAIPERVYVVLNDIPADQLPTGMEALPKFDIITANKYRDITRYNPLLASSFKQSKDQQISVDNATTEPPHTFHNMFDYDMMDYRKVSSVTSYDEGSSTSMTSLFSFEAALASQTFFSYQFSGRGFDMTSWHAMHEYLSVRRKVLALDRSFHYDPATQRLRIYPEPKPTQRFFGIVNCTVEQSIRNIIDRQWVFKYALATCKVILGTIRGKYGSVAIAGGGTVSDSLNLRSDGAAEMEKLEKELIEGTAYGEKDPPVFFVG